MEDQKHQQNKRKHKKEAKQKNPTMTMRDLVILITS
jgi:hypothetical protein